MFFLERVLRRGERDFWRVGLEGKVGVFLVVDLRFDPRSWVVVMSMKFWPFLRNSHFSSSVTHDVLPGESSIKKRSSSTALITT